MNLGQQSFHSTFDRSLGLSGRKQFFEQAEVGVDGDFALGHVDGAFDGRGDEGDLRAEGEGEGVTIPLAFLIHYLNGHASDAAKQIVERTIDNAFDLVF